MLLFWPDLNAHTLTNLNDIATTNVSVMATRLNLSDLRKAREAKSPLAKRQQHGYEDYRKNYDSLQ